MNIEVEQDDNMKLWNSWGKTDPAIVKKVSKGAFSFSAIDAYSQIKMATKMWGPAGRWGLKDIETKVVNDLLFLHATFFYPGGSFEMLNTASLYIGKGERRRVDDEAGKKILTDTLTKAFSYTGMNADVFEGKFDDSRYVNERKQEVAQEKEAEAGPARSLALEELLKKRGSGAIDEKKYELMKARLEHMDDVGEIKRATEIIKGFRDGQAS